MSWFSTLASVGMALGSPLVYLDQYLSIQRKKSSKGFSHLVCVVLLVANITRLFYWLGDRFDTALLVQSFLMIFAQVGLLRISLKYQTPSKPDSSASNMSILSSYSSSPSYSFDYYIDFLALLFSLESVLFILFQRYDTFIQAMGFFSLGLESTLPIPQLITNFRRKSLAGLSSMVLFGWLFGDSFKSIYLVFLMPNSNSIQFKICALFQLSIDILILSQSVIYRRQTKLDNAADQEEEEDQVAQQIDIDIDTDIDTQHSRLMIVDESTDHTTIV